MERVLNAIATAVDLTKLTMVLAMLLLWTTSVGVISGVVAYAAVMLTHGFVAPDNMMFRVELAFAAGAGIAMLMSVDSKPGMRVLRFIGRIGHSDDEVTRVKTEIC